jgi:hypothetical protein
MTGMVSLMAELKDQVSKIAESARRQEEIGQGLAKRQLVFQDQSQLYQRQIEQLTATVDSALRQVGKEVDRLSRAAADITLDSHRLSANIQQAARTISEAAEGLGCPGDSSQAGSLGARAVAGPPPQAQDQLRAGTRAAFRVATRSA